VARSIDAFRRIMRTLRVAARDTLASTGMSAAQLFILSTLAEVGTASISELAERTMTDRSSVSVVVDHLAESGLVARRVSPADRRRAEVSLTAAGRTVLRKAPPAPTALLVAALEVLPSEQLRRLSTDLDALTVAMGIATEPAVMLFEDGLPGVARTTPRAHSNEGPNG
jgi:DNA-binding MarR family transcriptional regulator